MMISKRRTLLLTALGVALVVGLYVVEFRMLQESVRS